MKPAFRPSPRIYRGQRRVVGPGCCPLCERPVTVNPNGTRRRHRDSHGLLCPGSGLQIVAPPVHDYDVDAAHAALAELERQAEARAQAQPPATDRQPAERRPGHCPECGQNPRRNSDGTLRAHRAEPDTFAGPYCPGGRPKGRQ